MTTPYDQARDWMQRQPSAVSGSGGHNQTYHVACVLLHGFDLSEADARALLADYNRTQCVPPWGERELEHKFQDATRAPADKPRGYMLRTRSSRPVTYSAPRPAPAVKVKPIETKGVTLPAPIPDGARILIREAFVDGECVCIAPATLNEDDREIPKGSGVVFPRAEWLAKLDAKNGDPNRIFSSTKKTGIYIRINPVNDEEGDKDSSVTSFRHALVEFDHMDPVAQWVLLQEQKLPCTAIISSGGKSIHAWVKVDAKDKDEYAERVKALYAYFAPYGFDAKNKNPSRFSRLPNCVRFDKRQELLAVNTNLDRSFTEWLIDKQVQGIGEVQTHEAINAFDPTADPNAVLGDRWLCKRGSCLLIGPSGIGKSSLAMQLAGTWAIGKAAFGIQPRGPFKVLFVQAENDLGDMAEMVTGVRAGMGIDQWQTADEWDLFAENLVIVRDTTHTGKRFTDAIRKLIDRYKPAMVVIDPLLSFIGADISRQDVCSEFLREWLNPISDQTDVIWFCVHHTGKPSTDPKAKRHWQVNDYSYAGIGSSELTNWARASLTLEPAGDVFRLMLSKRGKRAGATHLTGQPTNILWLQHAAKGIHWVQIDPPDEAPEEPKKNGRPKAEWNMKLFLETLAGEKLTRAEIKKRSMDFGGFKEAHFESKIWAPMKDVLVLDGKHYSIK
jgi:RecA-family ATPase